MLRNRSRTLLVITFFTLTGCSPANFTSDVSSQVASPIQPGGPGNPQLPGLGPSQPKEDGNGENQQGATITSGSNDSCLVHQSYWDTGDGIFDPAHSPDATTSVGFCGLVIYCNPVGWQPGSGDIGRTIAPTSAQIDCIREWCSASAVQFGSSWPGRYAGLCAL